MGSGRCDGASEEDRDTDEKGANDGNAEQRRKWKQSASNGQAVQRATDSNEWPTETTTTTTERGRTELRNIEMTCR